MRDYIPGEIRIDGRNIEYKLVTANDYLRAKHGYTNEDINEFIDEYWDKYQAINQIMGLKQSCYLLRRVSHSCGSLADDLFQLKLSLINWLKDEWDFDFDDQFVEDYGF